jgi:predicted amidohydrolase YtcJ
VKASRARRPVLGPKQRITVEPALESGKPTDSCVLFGNPLMVPPEAIRRIASERTVVGGKPILKRK